MKKKDLLTFLHANKHAVIATVGGKKPEAALIGFGETENLELVFGTSKKSRKYKNLKKNPAASFVIGLGEENITVQYEGRATELDQAGIKKYAPRYYRKNPEAKEYAHLPDQSYWKVTPTWIRYTNLVGEKEINHEFTF